MTPLSLKMPGLHLNLCLNKHRSVSLRLNLITYPLNLSQNLKKYPERSLHPEQELLRN